MHARYSHRLDTPQDRRRSEFYAEWVDVGFLRHRWTNDGEITEGVLRSNNPDAARYAKYAQNGVRTVVNLRDDINRAPVRLSEERCRELGIKWISFPMGARRAPTREELLGLIELFPKLEKPVLFHCKSGADRTGLVGAIWRIVVEGQSLEAARFELSIHYLHRRDSETAALDEVLDAFAPFEGLKTFAEWVRDDYDQEEVQRKALEASPQRGVWQELRAIARDLYRYAQHREALWHQSFEKPVVTDEDRKRANFFMKWVDHGVLRGIWTNFDQIGPGVFRSNHPTEKRFRGYAKQGFKTILNLRGASMAPQYQLEKALCEELGLKLIDLPMMAHKAPDKETALKLLDIFDTAERPMIIHCKSGADRTGIASALFKLHSGESIEDAKAQFSLRYVHLRKSAKGVLDRVVEQYEADTKAQQTPLRQWLETQYDPEAITAKFREDRAEGRL